MPKLSLGIAMTLILYTFSRLFSVFSCTYRRTLGPSDSRWPSVPLHAPGSRCARWALDTRLASTSFRTSSARLSRDADLDGKQGTRPDEILQSCSTFSDLYSTRKHRDTRLEYSNLFELTSPLAPGSPGSP